MLAQNFKSSIDLGITELQLSALQKTLVLLETGRLQHADSSIIPAGKKRSFSGHFNMANWSAEGECGTICCIGGTAELIGGVDFKSWVPVPLDNLFYVKPRPKGCDWHDITPDQAATALRSYLTTGDARWDLAVARSPQVTTTPEADHG